MSICFEKNLVPKFKPSGGVPPESNQINLYVFFTFLWLPEGKIISWAKFCAVFSQKTCGFLQLDFPKENCEVITAQSRRKL